MQLTPHPLLCNAARVQRAKSSDIRALQQDMLVNHTHPMWTHLSKVFKLPVKSVIEAVAMARTQVDTPIIDLLACSNSVDLNTVTEEEGSLILHARDTMLDLFNLDMPPTIYKLTKSIVDMMACTSMSSVMVNMLRTPYHRVYMDFGVAIQATNKLAFVGCYISSGVFVDSSGTDIPTLSVYIQSARTENGQVTQYTPMLNPPVSIPIGDNMNEVSINEVMQIALDQYAAEMNDLSHTEAERIMMNHAYSVAFSLSVKSLVYSTWAKARQVNIVPPTKAELKVAERTGSSTKRRILEAEFAKRKYAHIILGPESFVGPKENGAADGSGGYTVTPHWREGHFRSQHHGPGNSLVKTIFIEPYFTGHGDVPVKPTYELRA